MSDYLKRAEEFIWHEARLLDRLVFALQFRGGEPAPALAALLAYQNADGGFGNALEPDVRTPTSQPVPTQHGLEYLDIIGFDPSVVQRVCGFLLTIQRPDGGVPFLLPTALAHPRAPWWETPENPPSSLNPTALIAGLLHQHAFPHAWLVSADQYCRTQIEHWQPEEIHELLSVQTYLRHVPDRAWAEPQIERIGRAMLTTGVVSDPEAEGYVRDALDWAPLPDDPFRRFFPTATITRCLEVRLARQQEDGGWPITWSPPSTAAQTEWRGWVTRMMLSLLQANHVR